MTREAMVERLREKGLKVTPQRLAIIDALVAMGPSHPSAPQIYREGKKRARGLSLSTVYATLHEFARHDLLQTLEFDQMENRYEMNPDEHVNLICEGCGRIMDYAAPPAVDPAALREATGFRVRTARMEYYGYCRECLRAGTPATPRGGASRGGRDDA